MRSTFSEYSVIGFYGSKKEQCFRGCSACNPVRVFRSPSRFCLIFSFGTESPTAGNFNVFGLDDTPRGGYTVTGSVVSGDYNGDGNDENFLVVTMTGGNTIPGQPISNCGIYLTYEHGGKTYYSDDFIICPQACYGIEAWNDCDDPLLGPADQRFKLDIMELSFEESTFDIKRTTKTSYEGNDINTSSRKKIYNSANFLGDNSLHHALSLLDCYDNVIIRNLDSGCIWNISEFTSSKGGSECRFPITIRFLKAIFERGKCCFDAFQTPFETNGETDPPIDCATIQHDKQLTETSLGIVITDNPTGITPVCSLYFNNQFISNANSVNFGAYGTYEIICKIGPCEINCTHEHMDPKGNAEWDCEVNGPSVVFAVNGVDSPTYEIFDSLGTSVGTSSPFAIEDPMPSGNYVIVSTWTDANGNECQLSKTVALAYDEICDFDFTIIKGENGILEINWLTAIPDSPQYLWELDNGDSVASIGTGSEQGTTESGAYYLTVTSGDCVKKVDPLVCIIPAEKLQVEICNFDELEITVPPIEIPTINVEFPDSINVVICNDCDKPVHVCMCPDCEETECIPPEVVITCDDCIFIATVADGTGDGFSYSWCNESGAEVGTGLTLDMKPNDVFLPNGIYTLKASHPDCDTVEFTRVWNVDDPGNGGDTILKI